MTSDPVSEFELTDGGDGADEGHGDGERDVPAQQVAVRVGRPTPGTAAHGKQPQGNARLQGHQAGGGESNLVNRGRR